MVRGEHVYLAIDLKSFYASVECHDRGLDPLRTHLVVADEERTDKTICLAVSPSLKAYGIPGRARLFEVRQRLASVNAERAMLAPGGRLSGESCDSQDLEHSPRLKASMVIAKPRMAHYLEVSGRVYGVYLRYAAPEHMPADEDGVRVAELDEMSYRRLLWNHRPLTDFWRVGRGYARKLEHAGLLTMGDVARCSIGRASDYYNEDLLYRMFGRNAELLIDHAWGWEPCTIADIQSYEPDAHSISSGQVLTGPADYATGRLIVKEMADALALDLVGKRVLTNRLTLAVGYDIGSLDSTKLDSCADSAMKRASDQTGKSYRGPVSVDRYGRRVPKPATGSIGLGEFTSSSTRIREAMTMLYERIVDPRLLVRRLTVIADDVATANELAAGKRYEQLDLFSRIDSSAEEGDDGHVGISNSDARREHDMQTALLEVKRKFGRNAVIKAMDMEDGATGQDRNRQIGGHRA